VDRAQPQGRIVLPYWMVARMIFTPETSRILKVMVDSGQCSIREGEAHLAAATLTIYVDPACASEQAAQAAVVTAVATAVRCFIGGVWLRGATAVPVVLPSREGTIGEVAALLGAHLSDPGSPAQGRRIVIGRNRLPRGGWAVRAWWSGWQAGIRPSSDPTPSGDGTNSLAGAAAGALAVAAAFIAQGGDVETGRMPQTVSLWSPGAADPRPGRFYLPDALWLVGLGNLGQAYLWALSMLPYRDPQDLRLVLQDEDDVRDVNWGTSILVPRGRYGMLKTRMAEDFALDHGFRVRRIDQFLSSATSRWADAPLVALSGLDRIAARRLLGDVGFDRIIDCGLGATAKNYGRFRLNVFDPTYTAAQHFEGVEEISSLEKNLRLKAYQEGMAGTEEEACGMAELAGASAAAPFVSAFLATLAVTQAIKAASAVNNARAMVGSIGTPEDIRTSASDAPPARVGYAEVRD